MQGTRAWAGVQAKIENGSFKFCRSNNKYSYVEKIRDKIISGCDKTKSGHKNGNCFFFHLFFSSTVKNGERCP